MQIQSLISAFLLATTTCCLYGEEVHFQSKELVRKYHKNSELQRQWAYEALGDLSLGTRDSILDYGCGDGKVTASLSHHARKAHLLGVDHSAAMIDFAKKKFNSERYPNLSFELTSEETRLGEKYEEAFDLVVSFSVFEQVDQPEPILRDLWKVLKPGGTLAMVIPGREGSMELAEAFTVVRDRHGLTDAARPHMEPDNIRDIDKARQILKQAGFQVHQADIKPRMEPFVDKTDLVDWLEGTVVSLWNLPEQEGRELCSEIADEYLKRAPQARLEDGSIVVRMAPLHITAMKPRWAWRS